MKRTVGFALYTVGAGLALLALYCLLHSMRQFTFDSLHSQIMPGVFQVCAILGSLAGMTIYTGQMLLKKSAW